LSDIKEKNTQKWKDNAIEKSEKRNLHSDLAKLQEEIDKKSVIDFHLAKDKLLREHKLIDLTALEKFIRDSMDKNSSIQQKYIKRDSQYDVLIFCLHQLIQDETIIVDFGCGPYLNLLRQILDYQAPDDYEFVKKITYYGIDEFSSILSDVDIVEELILKYNNSEKDTSKIFYDKYSSLYNDIYKTHNKYSDLIIIKNVNHEVKLKDLSSFIQKIFNLVNVGGKIIFYDLSDIAEPLCYPWNKFMYESIFKDFFKCKTDFVYCQPTEKRVALHMCTVDVLNKIDYSLNDLKIMLKGMYDKVILLIIEEKNKYINGDRSHQNETFDKRITNFTKLIFYHSNLEQQLREAIIEWEIQ
jgi:hypothetical protein